MHDLLKKLEGGDRRSIGRANEVVKEVLNDLSLFDTVFYGMMSKDPLVRMRAADAVEKITAKHPECLEPHKEELIEGIARLQQKEVRWHVAPMLARLRLTMRERSSAIAILLMYLKDESKIVQASAMAALAVFAKEDPDLRRGIMDILEEKVRTGSPAVKSRGRNLLKKLRRQDT